MFDSIEPFRIVDARKLPYGITPSSYPAGYQELLVVPGPTKAAARKTIAKAVMDLHSFAPLRGTGWLDSKIGALVEEAWSRRKNSEAGVFVFFRPVTTADVPDLDRLIERDLVDGAKRIWDSYSLKKKREAVRIVVRFGSSLAGRRVEFPELFGADLRKIYNVERLAREWRDPKSK